MATGCLVGNPVIELDIFRRKLSVSRMQYFKQIKKLTIPQKRYYQKNSITKNVIRFVIRSVSGNFRVLVAMVAEVLCNLTPGAP